MDQVSALLAPTRAESNSRLRRGLRLGHGRPGRDRLGRKLAGTVPRFIARGPEEPPDDRELEERLRTRDRDRRAQQVLGRVVGGVTGMPLRLELLVEGPERFDLHRVADPFEDPLLSTLHEPVTGL